MFKVILEHKIQGYRPLKQETIKSEFAQEENNPYGDFIIVKMVAQPHAEF